MYKKLKFRPLSETTRAIIAFSVEPTDEDIFDSYGRLTSATLLLAALCGLTKEQFLFQCEELYSYAESAAKELEENHGKKKST